MIIIVCLDNKNGMMFNHRRQSQDNKLRNYIIEHIYPQKMFMNEYSAELFGENKAIMVEESFLDKAKKGDYCYVENNKTIKYENQIEKIIVYRWNRIYPSDFKFDIELQNSKWKLIKSTDFVGSSHDKITEEIYTK